MERRGTRYASINKATRASATLAFILRVMQSNNTMQSKHCGLSGAHSQAQNAIDSRYYYNFFDSTLSLSICSNFASKSLAFLRFASRFLSFSSRKQVSSFTFTSLHAPKNLASKKITWLFQDRKYLQTYSHLLFEVHGKLLNLE